jgi:hypothetical protein
VTAEPGEDRLGLREIEVGVRRMAMILREAAQQSEHDSVVRGLASIYESKGFTVWTNPDGEKNRSFDDRYPDVIVKAKVNDVYYLFEVETADSVTQTEAEEQWADYDGVWTRCWYLAVPQEQADEAKRLLAQNDIKHCTLVMWQRNANNTHTFWGLPGLK